MSNLQKRHGEIGQSQAALALARAGVRCVEKIGTPVKLSPAGPPGSNIFKVIFGEKVAGDHHGVLPGGRGVLVETKAISGRNLTWSDLREHQPRKLSEWQDEGGLSLLVWVSDKGIYIMAWPVLGFDGPRKSITLEMAERLDISGSLLNFR